MNVLKKFLLGTFFALFAICLSGPAHCEGGFAGMFGDIGDYGTWNTDRNHDLLIDNMTRDAQFIAPETVSAETFVPIEAKIGLGFMEAFSYVSSVIDISLVRFVVIFILIAYAFWIALESYMIIKGEAKANEKILEIIKRGISVFMWIGVLSFGPVGLFMLVVQPILFLGQEISDLILGGVTEMSGVSMPDTCTAIYNYVKTNLSGSNVLDANMATSLMCVPTRISTFCYTAAGIGWAWITGSLGNNIFSFVCGVIFAVGFIFLAWRYAFMAFGVIADLFLAIILLPFTAVAESVGKTTYKGIAGNIYNGFLELFKTEKLNVQIERFINVALFYVILSVIISISAALLSSVIKFNSSGALPQIGDSNFWVTALVLGLTFWFAKGAEKMATDIGGKISYEMGERMQKNSKNLISNSYKGAQSWWKAFRNARK